jgi:hypothetical protein
MSTELRPKPTTHGLLSSCALTLPEIDKANKAIKAIFNIFIFTFFS